MTIPNYITIFRFILVPFIVMALLSGYVGAALIGFVIAGVSDGIDGFIARRYNQGSELGAYLDPIADKLLLVSLFVVLGFVGVASLAGRHRRFTRYLHNWRSAPRCGHRQTVGNASAAGVQGEYGVSDCPCRGHNGGYCI